MISITWVSRNDNHGGRLLERIRTAVKALQYYWAEGLDVELIFVEWNPPRNAPRLYELIQFDPEFPVRWYVVQEHTHLSLPNGNILNVFPHIGANVGMRRARGDWVLTTTHDCVFSEGLAGALMLHEGFPRDEFFRARRFDTESYTDKGSMMDLLRLLPSGTFNRPTWIEGLFTKACGDFIMCTRDAWHAIRGYPEWAMNGIWLDGLLMHRLTASMVYQVVFNPPIYHMEHEGRGLKIYESQPHMPWKVYKRMGIKMVEQADPMQINGENWGFGDLVEEQIAPNIFVLTGDHAHIVEDWHDTIRLLDERG